MHTSYWLSIEKKNGGKIERKTTWRRATQKSANVEIAALEAKLSKARHRSCREHARRCETAGQTGHDVRTADGEG